MAKATNTDNDQSLPISPAQDTSNPSAAAPILQQPSNLNTAAQLVAGSGATALDLVVIIDTSGSMADEAVSLSQQIDAAIQKSSTACPSDLRVSFLGIQGTWANTKFTQSLSDYLLKNGKDVAGQPVTLAELQARQPFKEADGIDHAGNKEDLCRAVIDASKFYDWREGARRAIFVLGDEGMEGGGGKESDVEKTKNKATEAISVAQTQGVKVYTYQGTPDDDPQNIDRFTSTDVLHQMTEQYERLAKETGGWPYIYTSGVADFSLVLKEILCDSLTPPVISNPNNQNDGCAKLCEEFDTIMSTLNTLATIMLRAMDACCDNSTGKPTSAPTGCNCHKKP